MGRRGNLWEQRWGGELPGDGLGPHHQLVPHFQLGPHLQLKLLSCSLGRKVVQQPVIAMGRPSKH
jgi:hypothetical protein